MGITVSQLRKVFTAADQWAKTQGFGLAQQVPFQRAAEMIDAVASATKVSAAKVRDALLEQAAAANETSSHNLESIGGPASYRGASEHTPLRGDGGVRPMAALMDAKASPTSTVELSRFNTAFKKTADDFEATRVVLTRQATKKTVKELTEACGKLLSLFNQLAG